MTCSPSGLVVSSWIVAFSAFVMVIDCYDRFSGEVAVVLSATDFLMVSMILSCSYSCTRLDCLFQWAADEDERSESDGHDENSEKTTLPSLNAAA